jgi:Kef-type K+ transport system membrane component KefB
MDDLLQGIVTLLVVAVVSAAAPIVAALIPRSLVPQVVIMILGGVLVGPFGLGYAETASITLFANVGLGFVFLLAGYELEPHLFRERPGRLALIAWGVTAAIAIAVVATLDAVGFVTAFGPIAIGLTTTALGTLLPILREHDLLAGRFGGYVLAAGAVGELLPIIAIALFLGASGSLVALVSLAAMAGLAYAFTLAPRLARGPRVGRIIREGEHATSQTTLRWTIVLLLALLAAAAKFGLDAVLGAFLAGMVLRRWAPGDVAALERKLDAVGYGFFIPVFFVYSGMELDVRSVVENPLRLVAFFVLLLLARGLPALFVYRRALPAVRRAQLMFITATSLPLLVALSEIGLRSGTMLPQNAAALVGAGVLSVLVYPTIAVRLGQRAPDEAELTRARST